MNGEWFLWGGFVLSCFWHLNALVGFGHRSADDATTSHQMNTGLSGIALCAFGYLLFGG